MKDLVIIYSNRNLESERAICLMQSLEQKYVEYLMGVDFTEEQFISEFGEGASYPQIAIGLRHIGNLSETLKHFNYNGKL